MNYLATSCVPLLMAALGTPAHAMPVARKPRNNASPQRFLIERMIPGASKSPPAELRAGAAKSNAVLRELGPDIQWVHSY